MKARFKKRMLCRMYAQRITVPSVKVEVKSSAFNQAVLGLLFTQVSPIPELTEDNLDVVVEKRQRGRPRKHFPNAEERDDKITHKIEYDEEASIKTLPHATVQSMIADFRRHYVLNQIPLHHSLDRIAKAYKITYKQAHTMLQKEI